LNSYFGFERSISTISQDDVKAFFVQLSLRLSKCTMSRLFRHLKTVFKFAFDEGLLLSNPFSMKVHRRDTNEERQFYVSRDVSFRLLPFFSNDKKGTE
jgi:site-specific recombinase XerD